MCGTSSQKNANDTPEQLVEETLKMLWEQCELGYEWQQRRYAMLRLKVTFAQHIVKPNG